MRTPEPMDPDLFPAEDLVKELDVQESLVMSTLSLSEGGSLPGESSDAVLKKISTNVHYFIGESCVLF